MLGVLGHHCILSPGSSVLLFSSYYRWRHRDTYRPHAFGICTLSLLSPFLLQGRDHKSGFTRTKETVLHPFSGHHALHCLPLLSYLHRPPHLPGSPLYLQLHCSHLITVGLLLLLVSSSASPSVCLLYPRRGIWNAFWISSFPCSGLLIVCRVRRQPLVNFMIKHGPRIPSSQSLAEHCHTSGSWHMHCFPTQGTTLMMSLVPYHPHLMPLAKLLILANCLVFMSSVISSGTFLYLPNLGRSSTVCPP